MSQKPISENTLFYGDNLFILREHVPSESVDLIYLDPPFNSNRNYNVLFKDEHGTESQAQIEAFEDTWHWNLEAEAAYTELLTEAPDHIAKMMEALHSFIGTNQVMAYLVMMAIRLIELHRVLKPTGSLYLHCDWRVNSYLRILLDEIFGNENFINEIIWKRRSGILAQSRQYGAITDTILFYAKSHAYTFHPLMTKEGTEEYVSERFRYSDEKGRKYRISPIVSPSYSPSLIYEYKGYKPPVNGWACSRETMERWEKEGKLIFPENKEHRIQRKQYLDEWEGRPIQALWDDIYRRSIHKQKRG